MAQGALDGLRLIEMGSLIAGPFCGQLMADHGAEVIKIEAPGDGDPMRGWGREKPVWFPLIARNKKTITLNLKDPRGQELLKRLVKKSDFVLENFRPGTLERWKLGWEELSAENPGLIMIRVSGFGQTGPYAHRAGFGAIGEAMGGLRNLTGHPDQPPARVGVSIGDLLAASYACMGALMALHHRHRTGEGQVVDASLFELVLAMMELTVPEYTVAGFVRERTGAILPGIAPSNTYACLDADIVIGANQNKVFARLAAAMGAPELALNPEYATHEARGRNQQALDEMIAGWTAGHRADDALALLENHGVPAGRLYKAADMLDDPHFQAREALVKVKHPIFTNLVMQNVTPKLSATPGKVNWAGAEAGAFNHEIYGDLLGLSADDLAGLTSEGVI